MAKYFLRRVLYVVFVLFIVSIIMFFIYKAIPGDPALMMMEGNQMSLTPEQYAREYERISKSLGLDKPIYIQYFSWVGNMLTGNFGYSIIYKEPVIKMAAPYMMNTIKLNIITLIFVFAITIPLGILSAVKRGGIFDNLVQVLTILGYSLPGFIIALIIIFILGIKLQIFPISGVKTAGLSASGIAGFFDSAKHMVLPVSAMVLSSLGLITRYVRASMIEALRMDYIRTARAKGLREKVVIYSHAFRNSLIPLVTVMTAWFINIFSGSVVIEQMFAWTGMGRIMISSIMQRDFAVVLTFQMFYVLLALAGNIIMDIGYVLVDPRVKLS